MDVQTSIQKIRGSMGKCPRAKYLETLPYKVLTGPLPVNQKAAFNSYHVCQARPWTSQTPVCVRYISVLYRWSSFEEIDDRSANGLSSYLPSSVDTLEAPWHAHCASWWSLPRVCFLWFETWVTSSWCHVGFRKSTVPSQKCVYCTQNNDYASERGHFTHLSIHENHLHAVKVWYESPERCLGG